MAHHLGHVQDVPAVGNSDFQEVPARVLASVARGHPAAAFTPHADHRAPPACAPRVCSTPGPPKKRPRARVYGDLGRVFRRPERRPGLDHGEPGSKARRSPARLH